jgi:hypothetical protein
MSLFSSPVFSSEPVRVNSKLSYVGHSTTVYSTEQAIELLDIVGSQSDSEDCLPFAVVLVENGELISIAEDNGEFAAGELLAEALGGLDGFNALVCVSRKVVGCYPTDMVQAQKLRVIREAAVRSLEKLYQHLRPAGPTTYDLPSADEGKTERASLKPKRVSLPTPKMTYEQEQAQKNPVLRAKKH